MLKKSTFINFILNAGVAIKQYGNKVRDFFVGRDKMFHLPDVRTLNDVLRDETGIDDQIPPGFQEHSLELAYSVFGPDRPLILTGDERAVSTFRKSKLKSKLHARIRRIVGASIYI